MADEDRVSQRDRQSSVPMGVYVIVAVLAAVIILLLVTRPTVDSTDIAEPATTAPAATEAGSEPTAAQPVDRAEFVLEQPAGWTGLSPVELVKFKDYFAFAARRTEPDALVSVRVQEGGTADVNIDELADSLDDAMNEKFTDFEKVNEEAFKLDGKDALRYEYTFTSEQQEKVREQIIIVLADSRVFHIASWANDKDFAEVRADIDSIIDSFEVKQ